MLKRILKDILKGFQFAHQLSKKVIFVTILDAMLTSLFPFITLYMSSHIIKTLIVGEGIETLVSLVSITLSLNLFIFIMMKGTALWRERCLMVMLYHCDMRMNEKIMALDYASIENPKTHLLRQKIAEYENMNTGGPYIHMEALSSGLKHLFSVVFAFAMMPALLSHASSRESLYTLVIFSLIIFGLAASILIQWKNAKTLYGFFGEVMEINRISGYYQEHVADYHSGKGIRLYHQESLLENCVYTFINGMQKTFNKIALHGSLMLGFATSLSSLSTGLVFIYVGMIAANGSISSAQVMMYIGGIMQLMKGCEGVVQSFFEMVNNRQYLQDYFEFLELDTQMYHGSLPVEKRDDDAYEISFHQVSFKYPGSDIYALKNVTLHMKIGERMAIVGMNGSGKTTLIKLLCRLYDPTEGHITLNGIDIQKYDYEEYLSLFSVVFQDFKLFAFGLGQNVATSTQFDGPYVHEILDRVGVGQRVEKMARGLETFLYKHFDVNGEEVSGGEAQKIALARAVYRDAPIVILDEPTAALDPIAEYDIYTKFNDIIHTKTAFYISHRLSSCRFCDSIAVFHEGELIQKGHHDDLVTDVNGKYRELWLAQAQYYDREKAS